MRDNLCISFVEFHMKLFTRAVLHGILLIVFEMWWEYQERSLAFHEYVLELVIFPMWLTNMHKMLWVHERIWIVLFNVVGWIYCIFSCSSKGDQRTCQRKWFIAVEAGLNSKKKKKQWFCLYLYCHLFLYCPHHHDFCNYLTWIPQ